MGMLLIKNADCVLIDASHRLSGGDVLIEGARIKAVGRNIDAPGATRLDGAGFFVVPGFVNLHTHIYQSFLKGMRDDLRLDAWCDAVTFPFIGAAQSGMMDRDALFDSFATLGALEQLKSGITSFVAMDMSSARLPEAWERIGMRGTLALQTANRWIPDAFIRSDDAQLASLERVLARTGSNGLTRAALAPSTPFCCTGEYLKRIAKLARETDARIYIHVAETREEIARSLAETRTTPLAYLKQLGVLSERVTAVHCVHLTAEEKRMLRDEGVSVCHCPKSNAKLASGIAPAAELRAGGVTVGLGTDGAASNDLLDMFEEMRAALMLQKLSCGDPAACTAADVFRMVTQDGARALGLDAGTLEAGRLADLLLVNARSAHMAPAHDPVQSLVWCAKSEDVHTVIVDGRIVLENGRAVQIDENRAIENALRLERECRALIGVPEQ